MRGPQNSEPASGIRTQSPSWVSSSSSKSTRCSGGTQVLPPLSVPSSRSEVALSLLVIMQLELSLLPALPHLLSVPAQVELSLLWVLPQLQLRLLSVPPQLVLPRSGSGSSADLGVAT